MNVSIHDFEQLRKEIDERIYTELRGKHILIAGATGMLALYMTKFLLYLNETHHMNMQLILLARNAEKLSRLYGDAIEVAYVKKQIQDVCEPILISSCVDYIVHAAGSADPQSITKHPIGIMKANMLGTFHICDLAVEKHAKVLFLSTREIYGEQSKDIRSLSEEDYGHIDCLHTRSCYPISKKSGEAIMKSYASECNLQFQVARIAHAYGPGMMIENDGRIMADMIHDLVYKQDVVLKSEGLMKRSFCYVSDAIKALLYIMVLGESEHAYNVANETEELRVVDLAKMIANMANTNVVYATQNEKQRSGYLQIPRVSLDTSKLEKLGWSATVSLHDGIQRTWESFQDV